MTLYKAHNLKNLEIDGFDGFPHPAGTGVEFASYIQPDIHIAWCRN